MSNPIRVKVTIELLLETGTQMTDAVEIAESAPAVLLQNREVAHAELVSIERLPKPGCS